MRKTTPMKISLIFLILLISKSLGHSHECHHEKNQANLVIRTEKGEKIENLERHLLEKKRILVESTVHPIRIKLDYTGISFIF